MAVSGVRVCRIGITGCMGGNCFLLLAVYVGRALAVCVRAAPSEAQRPTILCTAQLWLPLHM